MKLDRLSHDYIGDFAQAVALGPPRIAFALYDEPNQWRGMVAALEEDLRFYGARLAHLERDSAAGGPLAEQWIQTLEGAGSNDRLFVVDEVSLLPDDTFRLLFQALEERRELILSVNKGTFLVSVTPERVDEIALNAPGFYSVADVVLLSQNNFRLPDDPAYAEDRTLMEAQLRALERKYSFPSDELWERMVRRQCDGIPEDDLRRWERLVEALREE